MAATSETTRWHPADVFSHEHERREHKEFALVVLNQPMELRAVLYKVIWENAVYQVAADGGANRVHNLMNTPGCEIGDYSFALHTVIGDLDSLRPDVRKFWHDAGSEIIHDPDQYSTDFAKAVNHIKTVKYPGATYPTPSKDERGNSIRQRIQSRHKPVDIVCIGGLGGRVDQGMSTLHYLYTFQQDPHYQSGRMFILSSEAITFVLKSGTHKIKVRESFTYGSLGNHIGIIPLKEPSVITTNGLEWDVKDWPTEFGGQMSTSNHVREDWVTVETTKDVLFTIDLNVTPRHP